MCAWAAVGGCGAFGRVGGHVGGQVEDHCLRSYPLHCK